MLTPVGETLLAGALQPSQVDQHRLARRLRLRLLRTAHHRASRSAARYAARNRSALSQFVPEWQARHFWVCTMYARYVACKRPEMGGVVMVGSMSQGQ